MSTTDKALEAAVAAAVPAIVGALQTIEQQVAAIEAQLNELSRLTARPVTKGDAGPGRPVLNPAKEQKHER